MKLVVAADARDAAIAAADVLTERLRRNARLALGLATGSSPSGLYTEMACRAARRLDLTSVAGFALDEYVGLVAADPAATPTSSTPRSPDH